MYTITGKKPHHKLALRVKTMQRAIAIADQKIEEGFEDVTITIYNDQLPLFDGEYYEEG